MKPKKKARPPKGNAVPNNKPENSYKKVAKAGITSRIAGKKETPKK